MLSPAVLSPFFGSRLDAVSAFWQACLILSPFIRASLLVSNFFPRSVLCLRCLLSHRLSSVVFLHVTSLTSCCHLLSRSADASGLCFGPLCRPHSLSPFVFCHASCVLSSLPCCWMLSQSSRGLSPVVFLLVRLFSHLRFCPAMLCSTFWWRVSLLGSVRLLKSRFWFLPSLTSLFLTFMFDVASDF